MYCPLKFSKCADPGDGSLIENIAQCEKEKCAWWNAQYCTCCIAVPASITAAEENRREVRAENEFRRRYGE